ncbi:DUF1294 domain-containing protein [Methanoculleus sp. UBA303]|jgi:uncharacterized membrane protein YsdA (DUF1294 family)|uniref:DUF1294 domain-containing protein n=1 Tax=Methanoculleus sp. UBA303 TaxID=1915497 RepID=UPI0025D55697|nr:DUF1294 domain-containing protein [Methanoculleus sp. UBA303]
MPLLPAAAAVYLLANILSFSAFFRDKRSAERTAWRTPEQRLLVLALFGPFGALAAMRAFRHKTQKAKFRLVPLFLCLHIGLAIALVLVLV